MYSKRLILILFSMVAFVGLMLFTNPAEINLYILLVPFILLGVALYNILALTIEKFFNKSAQTPRRKILSLITTVVIVNCLLLSSIGQLTLQDTILAVLITVVGGFYLFKFQVR